MIALGKSFLTAMTKIATEAIKKPLVRSGLRKKGLCDYVVNVATGCLHGCSFCYVPSTPAIRMNQTSLAARGVETPMLTWGQYLFVRDGLPRALDDQLRRMRMQTTEAGKGVVMLCSTTDPYQNLRVARVTRQAVEILLKHGQRVRILTRSPLWLRDLDLLAHPNVTVGMSLPHLNDQMSRLYEPKAPLPTHRLAALRKGREAGCRMFVAIAPTPQPALDEMGTFLKTVEEVDPEIYFWEAINDRGTNKTRMIDAGIPAEQLQSSPCAQWQKMEQLMEEAGLANKFHPWPDRSWSKSGEASIIKKMEYWWDRPTVEQWDY